MGGILSVVKGTPGKPARRIKVKKRYYEELVAERNQLAAENELQREQIEKLNEQVASLRAALE